MCGWWYGRDGGRQSFFCFCTAKECIRVNLEDEVFTLSVSMKGNATTIQEGVCESFSDGSNGDFKLEDERNCEERHCLPLESVGCVCRNTVLSRFGLLLQSLERERLQTRGRGGSYRDRLKVPLALGVRVFRDRLVSPQNDFKLGVEMRWCASSQ